MEDTRTPAGWRTAARLAPILLVTLALTACFDDNSASGTQAGSVPVQSTGASATNAAPVVAGTPATEIPAGFPYVFKPTVSDPEGDAVTLQVQGAPRWATFESSTGELRGTPTDADVGDVTGIVIKASDGKATTTFGPFSVKVKRPTTPTGTAGSRPPTIGGTPPTTVAAGSGYSFQAVGADPDGDRLTYGATNLPSWLGINTANGILSGTPSAAQVGVYPNITISVTDGNSSATLAAFTITVTAPTVVSTTPASTTSTTGTGTATLVWQRPVQNTDGSVLQDLSGYIIKYGTDPAALSQTITLTDPDATGFTLQNLGRGTWYFTVAALTRAGLESDLSPLVSKTIL